MANASHELRTPLTMMRTAIDVAATTPAPPGPDVTVLMERVRLGLDRADRLVEGFLILARAQHGVPITHNTVPLDQLASTVVADHAAEINRAHLTIRQDHQQTRAYGDQVLLTHLIGNLIDNAIRHNQPGGWIQVTTDTETDTTRLVVENSGALLDQSCIDELTQPFRRMVPDRTATHDTGVGLGLSIVAAIVTTHDGTLGLYARPAGGLRVTVTLPLAARAAPTPVLSG